LHGSPRNRSPQAFVAIIPTAVIAFPLALWRNLLNLSDQNLRRQGLTLDAVLAEFNGYYSATVVDRIKSATVPTTIVNDYHDIDGAIPIPATVSIELGDLLTRTDGVVDARFVSDFTFDGRERTTLSDTERRTLNIFRDDPDRDRIFVAEDDALLEHRISLMTPGIMTGHHGRELCVMPQRPLRQPQARLAGGGRRARVANDHGGATPGPQPFCFLRSNGC